MNIPVFLAADNNYAPFVATTIASICDNTKSFVDFYVLDGGITQPLQAKILALQNQFSNCQIEFISIDLAQAFHSIEYKNHSDAVTVSTYSRFLIPKLKPHLQKIIYLDTDIIVLGDIANLYAIDLDQYAGAFVPDQCPMFFTDEIKTKMHMAPEHVYFNAGVMLLDNHKWVENHILEQLFPLMVRD